MKQLICLAGFLVFLVGCSSKLEPMDEDVVTVPEIGEQASVVDNNAPEVDKSPPVSVPDDKYFGLWWRHLGSAELEKLIDRMIVNNQQLQISAQRVVQAKARSIQDYAQTLPEVTTTAGYTLEAPEGGLGSVPKGSSPSSDEEFEVGLNARYTVDIWGERASFAQASQYRLQRAVYEYDARLLQTITDLSKAYLEYLALNDRIRSARESDTALNSMLKAMADLYEQGDATVVEMQIQRSSVYNSRVVLPTLELSKEQVANRIARLVGVAPGELRLSDLGLDSLTFPSQVQGISSAYILRRPDIQAIEAAMLAADADIDVARKALLPSLELAAEIGFGSASASQLFQPHTLMWNFVSNLTATIFDGGRREQQIKFAQAVRAELVETYVFNVYSGLQQARDALNGIKFTERRLSMQKTSTEAAKEALDLGLDSYRAGGIDFLTFLDSTHSYQRRKDELFTFYLEYYQSFIDLYGALGGGIPYRGAYSGTSQVKGSIAALDAGEQKKADELSGPSWVEGEEGWLVEPERYRGKERWLVRLSGVFDAFATESVLKDFRRRYQDIRPAKALLAERIGFTDSEKQRQASWYALNITGFQNKDEAEDWCSMLRKNQQRCIVFQPDDNFEVDGVFLVDKRYASESLVALLEDDIEDNEESKLLPGEQTSGTLEEEQIQEGSVIDKRGLLYSLLKSDGTHAWLIGNNTFRVWKYQVNADLYSNGRIVALKKDLAILNFDNSGVRLQPLYVVESIEQRDDGSVLAYLRWGSARAGRVYSHRVGDRVYGGGVIKSIDESGVTVSWGEHNILLELKQ